MGTLDITRNDDRLDTMIGRIPIRVHRSAFYDNYDIHLFFNMVNAYINKNHYKNIYDYNVNFKVNEGLIIITFELKSDINTDVINERLENILSLVNSQLKPQLHTIYNMSYQSWRL